MKNTPATHCPKCGYASENSEVCDSCGALLSRLRNRETASAGNWNSGMESPATPPPLPKQTENRAVKAMMIAVAIGAAVMFFRGVTHQAGGHESPHVVNLTTEEFEGRVLRGDADRVWVLDFWAPWCGPCRKFGPEFSATADQLSARASFAKINVDDHPRVAQQFNVSGIPTVVIVRGGSVVAQVTGGMDQDDFRQWLEPHL